MTEAEWLACEDPGTMLNGLTRLTRERSSLVSHRKLLLFGVACYRKQIGEYAEVLACSVADAANAFADGRENYTPIHRLWQETEKGVRKSRKDFSLGGDGWEELAYSFVGKLLSIATPGITREQRARRAAQAIYRLITEMRKSSARGQTGNRRKQAERMAERSLANGLREVFGNPFRPATFEPAWRTSDVMLLARGIYEERAFDRMPILADALQDAGCDNPDILSHLRDANATHVRGCWALDLVLGKE
jgi:hypothetical protein